jgi:hypothetical protein
MNVFLITGFSLILVIAVLWAIFYKRKRSAPESAALSLIPKLARLEVEPHTRQVPDRVVIGSNPASPVVTIEMVRGVNHFENATELDIKSNKSVSRLSALCQAIPSVLVAGEASGKKLMEVVISGDLVRATDGSGFRPFAMSGNKIVEQARLFEVSNLGKMIDAAAIWQIASVVVAQKHLADINRQLNEIKEHVKHISQFLDNQRKARVSSTYDYLEQVSSTIKGGDLPQSSRIQLESCERDLLEIQHHLQMEYRQKIDVNVKHIETFGSEVLTNDIDQKIAGLEALAGDMALCLKTRIAAWHVLSLFPGEPHLKEARRASIQKSIETFTALAPHFEECLKTEIAAVNAFWNWGSTLDERKRNLETKRVAAVETLERVRQRSTESVAQTEHLLLEHDQPIRLYLQYENGELTAARQAVK